MSRIQKVQSSYQQRHSINTKNNQVYGSYPSFGSALGNLDEAQRFINNETLNKVNGILGNNKIKKGFKSLMNRVFETQGEIQNQIFNAFFTSTLAYVMVRHNPLSKKDEKTRAYGALRQPVSAGIALTGGLGLTMAVNKYTDYLINSGAISGTDGRLEPTDSFLKKLNNKAYKDYKQDINNIIKEAKKSNKSPDEEVDKYIKEFIKNNTPDAFDGKEFDKNGKPTKEYIKACVKQSGERFKKARTELFAKLIGEDPSKFSIQEVEVSKGNKTIKEARILFNGEEIGKNIPNLKTTEDLTKYLNKHNINNKKLSTLMSDVFKFEFYKDGALEGTLKKSSLSKFDEINALDFLKEIGVLGDKTSNLDTNSLNLIMSKIRQPKLQTAIKDSVRGLALKTDGEITLSEELGKTMTNIAQNHSNKATRVITLRSLLNRLGIESNDDFNKYMQKDIASIAKEISDAFKNATELTTAKSKGKVEKIVEKIFTNKNGIIDISNNIVKNMATNLKGGSKTFSRFTTIVFNLPMTMITCTILNFTYPRFVDKFFPQYSKKKPESTEVKGGAN